MIENIEAKVKPIAKRITLAGGTLLVSVGVSFGLDQGPNRVSADEPNQISTSTPTRNPTLEVLSTQVAQAQASVTALAEQVQRERQLANIEATQTALARQQEALRITPTETATPTHTRIPAEATATADAIRLNALGIEQARIKATATADAERRVVPTSVTTPVRIPGEGVELRRAEGGINVEREILKGEAIALALLIALSLMALRTRNQLLGLIGNATRAFGRGMRWLWQHRPGHP